MPKTSLDRLRKRYGFKGENLEVLMKKIIQGNNESISNRVASINKDVWNKKLSRLSKTEKFVIPSVESVLPKRSVFIKKAAEDGKLISDTLRDRLTGNLREALNQFTPKTGEQTFITRRGVRAGRINQKLVKEFEKNIRGTFKNYVRKDPAIGVPKNVAGIAVTEMRSTVTDIKKEYMTQLSEKNENLVIKKTWIHNKSLSVEPRKGHMQQDGVTKAFDKKFKVALFKKIKGRWFKVGVTFMDKPYDPEAPAVQKIGCNCDILYKATLKKTKKS
jgi:hypothetical protein